MFNIHTYKKILKEIEVFGKKTQIVAVSKNHPKEAVEDAIKRGVEIFGENRVQEAKIKFQDLIFSIMKCLLLETMQYLN